MPTFESSPRPRFGTIFLEREIASDAYYKDPLIRRVATELKRLGYLSRADERTVRQALDEAIGNAIGHGNANDPSRKVRVRVFGDQGRWAVEVEDEGKGMKPNAVPRSGMGEGAGPPWRSGRGLRLMEGAFGEVVYLGRGNVLLMVRARSEADPEAVREGELDAPVSPDGAATAAPAAPAESELAFAPDETREEPERPRIVGELVQSTEIARTVDVRGSRVVEILPARLSDENIHLLRAQLADLARGQRTLVLDFRNVEQLSSIVVGALMGFLSEFEKEGGDLRICCVSAYIEKVLDCCGVSEVLSLFSDHLAAIAKG